MGGWVGLVTALKTRKKYGNYFKKISSLFVSAHSQSEKICFWCEVELLKHFKGYALESFINDVTQVWGVSKFVTLSLKKYIRQSFYSDKKYVYGEHPKAGHDSQPFDKIIKDEWVHYF